MRERGIKVHKNKHNKFFRFVNINAHNNFIVFIILVSDYQWN